MQKKWYKVTTSYRAESFIGDGDFESSTSMVVWGTNINSAKKAQAQWIAETKLNGVVIGTEVVPGVKIGGRFVADSSFNS